MLWNERKHMKLSSTWSVHIGCEKIRLLRLTVYVLAGAIAGITSLQAASFDCGKAVGYAEAAVCEFSDLSELDDKLSTVYQAARADATAMARSQIERDQRNWLQQRNSCLDRVCLQSAYEHRIRELTIDSPCCPEARCTHLVDSGPSLQLIESIEQGNVGAARASLARAADPNACSENCDRPLHLAVFRQDEALVRELLRAKANPNTMNCPANTPLNYSAQINSVEISKLLLEAGAEPDLGGQISPLTIAASHGHIEMVKILLDHGASPNSVHYGTTALTAASENRHVEVVRLLLDHGADANIQDNLGGTALFRAIGGFRIVPPWPEEQDKILKIVQLLVQHGARVDILVAGQSPLQRAEALKEDAIAQYLIEVDAK